MTLSLAACGAQPESRPALAALIREAGPDRLFPCWDERLVRLLPVDETSD